MQNGEQYAVRLAIAVMILSNLLISTVSHLSNVQQ